MEMLNFLGYVYMLWIFLFFLQTDKKRVVDESDGRLWADSHGYHYFEVSAQTGEGVSEMFQVTGAQHHSLQESLYR